MILYVAIDNRFVRCGDAYYTDISFPYAYWQEYLDVFDEVRPVARVWEVATVEPGWVRADGPGVRLVPIAPYDGIWQFAWRWPRVLRDGRRAVDAGDAFLLRWGLVGVVCWFWLRRCGKPFAFECVGNAGETVERVGSLGFLGLNRLSARITDWLTRRLARDAYCAAYVSRYAQRLYPHPSPRQFIFSGVQLRDGVMTAPRPAAQFQVDEPHIVSVGRMEPEKGHAVLVEALGMLAQRGRRFRATLIGPGREVERLQQRVRELGLDSRVNLAGRVEWGGPLWGILDSADLFVLPSLTEGMPRAMIEAMARGLPAIGSDTGGITELLEADDLSPPGDAAKLAERMERTAYDADRLAQRSARNFERAQDYAIERMRAQKHAFWGMLKAQVAAR